MIFDFAEIRCTLEVLIILEKEKSRYSVLFKKTQVSHTTLQKVLRDLIRKKFIDKNKDYETRGIRSFYEINNKGKKLLRDLEELKETLK